MHPYVSATLGGILIGLAAWLLLAALGRIAGISGITAGAAYGTAEGPSGRGWRWAFLAGLLAAGTLAAGALQVPTPTAQPRALLLVAGLLVGFGTVLGAGCTSGHGVCGLGRRSPRSLAATATFMVTGIATVALLRAWQA